MLTAVSFFDLNGTPVSCQRYGNGHINETYLVSTDAPRSYILQKINHRVFTNVPALMENIAAVTRWLDQDGDTRHTLRLIPTKAGDTFFRDAEGLFWRAYAFVTDSICLERAESAEDFYQSAVAFGGFQRSLANFPAHTLHETIPHFHDTPARFAALHAAAQADAAGRLKAVGPELSFALEREKEAGALINPLHEGKLPLRVTHNDTKLNNVLLDAATRKPLCVIDLDTVMPGLAMNDFGDSIRFGASTAAEDERDLSRVQLSLELYEAYARGFLGMCGETLTEREVDLLPMGAKLMTLECGVRFLTDYLNGDTYFAIHRTDHNLDRCRTQFELVRDMERKWDAMIKLILRHHRAPATL